MTLAEAALVTPKKALEYISEPNGELDMMIQFQCMGADCLLTDYIPLPFSLLRMKKAFGGWQRGLAGKSWNMLYLENHDHPRIISRYGSEKFRVESGKCLAAAYLFCRARPLSIRGRRLA